MYISVALCTYNGARYIKDQLDSILSQELQVHEVVICDDGSTDGTVDQLKIYQEKYPGLIKVFCNDPSLRVVKNFEKAINLCVGDLVLLSDQDDIWFPSKTKEVVAYFEAHPDKEAIFHNLELYDGTGLNFTIWEYLSFTGPSVALENSELIKYCNYVDNVVTGAAFAFKNNAQVRFSEEVPSMLHDFQLFTSFALNNKLGVLNKVLGYYRIHEQQQVGARTEKNEYLATKKERYFGTDYLSQLFEYEAAINKNRTFENSLKQLTAVNAILRAETIKLRDKVLKGNGFLKRKQLLLQWFLQKRFQVTLLDLITK